MNKKLKKGLIAFISLLLILTVFDSIIYAHPGRLDSNGGHNDYIHGGYHYHDGSGSSYSSDTDDYEPTKQSEKNSSGIWISSSTIKIILCFVVAIAILIILFFMNPITGFILYAYVPLLMIVGFINNKFDVYIEDWEVFFLPIAIYDVFIIIETIIEKIYKHKRK